MTRPHGTNARYHLDACRCDPCRAAAAAYESHKRRQIAYGRWTPYVDAQPSRDHVNALRAAGMGLKRIAEVSGVPHGSLAKLIYGDGVRGLAPSKRVRPETQAKILATPVDPYPGGNVCGIGTRRRLRALVALGYGQYDLARRLGLAPATFWHTLRRPPYVKVAASTRAATVALYEELAMTLPPTGTPAERNRVKRAKAVAERNDWVPPLALDDDRLDDPTYKRNRGPIHKLPPRLRGRIAPRPEQEAS